MSVKFQVRLSSRGKNAWWALVLLMTLLASAPRAAAQSYTWDNPAGGSWATSSNWMPSGSSSTLNSPYIPSYFGASVNFGTLTLSSNATVTLDGNQTVGSLTFGDVGNTYNWTLNPGTPATSTLTLASIATPSITVATTTTTLNVILAGTQGFTLTGPGTLVLGAANTNTGAFTVNSGTLQLANSAAALNNTVVLNGGALTFANGITTASIGGLSGAVNVSLLNAGGSALSLNLGTNNAAASYSGVLSDGALGATVVKTGFGTQVLSGANTFTGGVTISGGTLNAGGAQTASAGPLGALGTGSITLNGGTLQYSAFNQFDYSPYLNSTSSTNYAVDTNYQPVAWASTLTGSASLTKFNQGTLTLTGANTFTGGTASLNITGASVSGGVVTISTNGNGLSSFSAGLPVVIAGVNGVGTAAGYNGTFIITGVNGNSFTYADTAATGSSGTAGGTGSVTAGTTIAGGVLNVGAAQTPSSGPLGAGGIINFTGGTLQYSSANQYDYSSQFSTAAGQLYSVDTNGQTVTWASPLTSSSGSLTVVGGGTLILTAANTFGGPTTINSATLQVANSSALQGSTVYANSGLIFASGITNATFGSLAGSGNLSLLNASSQPVALTLAGTGLINTYSGVLSGAGASLTVSAGTLTLSGLNTYSGGTTLVGGIVNVGSAQGAAGPLGSGGTIIFSGGTLQYSAANQFDYSSQFGTAAGQLYSVDTNNQTVTWATALTSTSGSLTKLGAGTLILTGAETYSGTTTIGNGTLQVGNGASGSLATSALTFTGSGTFNLNEAAGSQSMGTLTLSAGAALIQSTYGGSGTTNLTFSSLAPRAPGATANFVLSGGTAGTPGNPGTPGTNNIVLTGQAAGFISQGTFFGGGNYAWYDAGGFVRGINWGVDAGSTTVAGGTTLTGTYAQTTAAVTAQATGSFTAINIVNTTNTAQAFTLATGATLTTSGILRSGNGGATSTTTISGGTAINAPSGGELVIRADQANDLLTISTVMAANGVYGVTKTGAGTLTTTVANTFTGPLTLNAGVFATNTLATGSAAQGMGESQSLVLNGGTFQYTGGNFAPSNTTGWAPTITVGNSGGTINTSGGLIFSTATLAGSGTLTVINSANTNAAWFDQITPSPNFTGNIVIGNGVGNQSGIQWRGGVAANPLGTGTITVNSGGLLMVEFATGTIPNNVVLNGGVMGALSVNGTYTGNITLQASSSIGDAPTTTAGGFNTNNSPSINITVNGIISGGSGASLTKISLDTATLTAVNTYTGATIVNQGVLVLASPGALGNTAVNVANSSNAATLVVNGNYTIGTGGPASLTVGTGTAAGTLSFLNTEAVTRTLTVNSSAATAVTIGNLASLNFNYSAANTVDNIVTNSGLTVSGSGATLNLTPLTGATTLPVGAYNLMTFGSATGLPSLSLQNVPLSTTGTIYYLTSTPTNLVLNVATATSAGNAYWSGAQGTQWNANIGVGTSNFWTTPTGTTDAGPPVYYTNVFFTSSSTNLTNSVGQNTTINSLNISNAAAVTIGGAATLQIMGAGVNGNTAGNGISVASGSGAVTISAPIVVGAAQTWTNAASTLLTVSGAITANGNLTIAGTGNTTITGLISGPGGLVMNGSGTLALGSSSSSGNKNTFTGNTIVNSGILLLQGTNSGTGIISGTVTVNPGGLLNVSTANALGYSNSGVKVNVINVNGATAESTAGGNDQGYGLIINLTAVGSTGATLGASGSRFSLGGSAAQGGSAVNSYSSTTSATTVTNTITALLDMRADTYYSANSILPITAQAGPTAGAVDLSITGVINTGDTNTDTLVINAPAIGTAGKIQLGTQANTFTGGTIINAGTLQLVGNNSGTGDLRGAITVNPGATLVAITNSNAIGYTNSNIAVTTLTINGGTVNNNFGGDFGYMVNYRMSNGGLLESTASGAHISVGSSPTPGATFTEAGSVVTAAIAAPTGTNAGISGTIVPGAIVTIGGASNTGYNGTFVIQSVNGNSFTYNLSTTGLPSATTNTVTTNTLFTSLANTGGNTLTNTISATLQMRTLAAGSTIVFNVAKGAPANGIDLNVTGQISNASATDAITKLGAGAMQLANTTNGQNATYVANGTLLIGGSSTASAGLFGSGSVFLGQNVASTSTIPGYYSTATGGALLSNGAFTTATPIVVATNPTTGINVIGGNTDNTSVFSGPITLNGNLTVTQVANAGANFLSLTGTIGSVASGTQTVTFAGPGNITVSNLSAAAIGDGTSGNVAVAVTGGSIVFASGNTYSGGTTISGGVLTATNSGGSATGSGPVTISGATLQVGNGGSSGSVTGPINFGSGAANNLIFNLSGSPTVGTPINVTGPNANLTVATGLPITLSGVFGGTGAVKVSGSLTLSGTSNTFSGALSLTSGSTLNLQTTGLGSGASVTVADNVSPSSPTAFNLYNLNNSTGPLSLSSLTFGTSTGATLGFGLNAGTLSNYALAVANSNGLVLHGTTTINVSDAQSLAGTFPLYIPLIQYTGSNITSGFTLGALPTARTVGQLVYNYTGSGSLSPQNIYLKITGTDSIKWTGLLNGNSGTPSAVWDVGTTVITPTNPGGGGSANWQSVGFGYATNFVQGDSVVFDDTAGGPTAISLTVAVTPSSINFNNNSLSYSITGAGGSIGDASGAHTFMNLNGSQTVTLGTLNTYSGGTNLFSGQLNINAGAPTASAIGAGPLFIGANTAIDNTSGAAVSLGTNNPQTWAGNFTFGASNSLNLGTGSVLMQQSATITTVGAATLTIGGAIGDGGMGFGLTLQGPGGLTLNGANSYSGPTTINGGTLTLGGSGSTSSVTLNGGQLNINAPAALGAGTLTIGAGTTISNTSGAAVTVSTNNPQTWNGNFTFAGNNPLNLGTGAVNLGAPVALTINNSSTLTVGGVVGGGGGITLNGTGTLFLNNNETYTGPTVVNGNSTLQVNGTNIAATAGIASSGSLTINSGGTVAIGVAGGPDNSLGGNASALVITINTGGLLTNATGYFGTNHLSALNLYGGTLGFTGTPTGSSATFGTYNLDQGLTAGGGPANSTSVISAPNVALTQTGGTIFNVSTAAIQTVPGVDLDVTGYFGAPTGVTNTGLILNGGGVMRLDGANTFTQATTITSGTLILGNGGSTGLIQSKSVTVNGTLAFNLSSTAVFAPSAGISGSGTISQTGTGIVTLGGANSFSGNVIVKSGLLSILPGSLTSVTSAAVSGGTLILQSNSINSSAAVTVSDGAGLTIINTGPGGGSVMLGSLTLGTSTGGNLNFTLNGVPSAAALNVSNPSGIMVNGSVSLAVTNTQAFKNSPTEYPLIAYSGPAITQSNSPYVLQSFSGRTMGSLDYSQPGLIQLQVTASAIVWTGMTSTAWDTATPNNWSFFNGTTTVSTTFNTGDAVIFDDSATSAVTPGSVTLAASVQPSSVTFNNNSQPYTISGAGAIADGASQTSLSIAGTGTVTLQNANTYSGGTFVSSGQLNINNASAIGTGLLTISGGTISNTSGSPITLSTSNSEYWLGNFTFAGDNALNMGIGGVTLGANVTLTALGGKANPLTIGGTITGIHALTVAGSGAVNLAVANTFTGGLTLTGSLLNLGNAGALGTGTFTITGGSFDNTSGAAFTLPNLQVWNGNFTFVGSQSITVAAAALPVTLAGNSVITLNGTTPTAAGSFPAGTLVIGTGATASTNLIVDNGSNYSLGVSGTGTLNLLIGSSAFGGGLTVGSTTGTATVILGNNSTAADEVAASVGTGPVTLNAGGVLWAQSGSTTTLYTFNNNFVLNGGTFIGQDGLQHLGSGSSTITVNGPNTSMIESTFSNKPIFIDGLLQGTGNLLLQHGPTNSGAQTGIAPFAGASITQVQVHISNPSNTYSGVLSVSGAGGGSGNMWVLIDAPTALQFATINTFPGSAGTAMIDNTTGATIAALTGNGGSFLPFNAAAGTTTLTLAGNGILGNTNTYGGVLANQTGLLALTMQTAANQTQILTGINTYTGPTTVNSGTLQIGNGTTGSISTTGSVAINGGATLAFNVSASTAFAPSGGISGNGTLNQMGPGTLTLVGPNTFAGNLLVSGGILRLSAQSVSSSVTAAVGDAGTLSAFNSNPSVPQTVTLSSLTLGTTNGGANLTFELNGTPNLSTIPVPLSATTLTKVGATASTLNITDSAPLTAGASFPVLAYTGPQITSGFASGTMPGSARGASFTVDYSHPGYIYLDIVQVAPITWTGVVAGSVWNQGTAIYTSGTNTTGGALNWKSPTVNPTNMVAGDAVVFDDSSASVAASPGQVVITGNVAPSSVLFNNLNLAYSLGGTGAIVDGTSPAAVTINGGGTVSLATANTYSGGTTLLNGQLNINNATAIGTGTLTIGAGTKIDNTTAAAITLANNNPMNWGGSFTFVGSNSLNLGTGTITLGGNLTLTMNGAQVNKAATFPVGTLTTSGTITDNGNNYMLSISSGTMNLLTAASTYTGGTSVTNATIILGNASAAATENVLALGTGTITLNSGAVLWPQPGSTANVYTFNNNFVFNGGTFDGEDGLQHIGSGGTITVNGPNTSTLETNWPNKPLYVDGLLQGSGNLLLQQGTTASGPETGIAPFSGSVSGAQVHITNGSNTYSGIVSVSGAVPTGATTTGVWLLIDATTALQFATINTNPGVPGTVFINNSGGAIIAGLTGSAGKIEPVATLGTTSLTINTTGPNVYGGVLIDNTSTLALNVNGTGSLTLSGNNTYSGGTTLTSAQLNINSATAIGTGQFTIASGTIDNTSGAPITNSNNNAMNWNGSFTFGGTSPLNLGTGAVSISSSLTVTTNGTSAAPLTVGGVITDNGGGYSLTKAGPGTLILTGVNTYSGGTTIIGGELNINSDSALGAATAPLNLNGGALQFAAGGGINLGASRPVILGGGAFDTNSGFTTVSSVLSGSSSSNSNLIVGGGGALTLNAVNTYAGSTSVNGAFLIVPAGTNISGGALNVSNTNTATPPTESGLFLSNGAQTVGPLSGTITQPAGGNTATIFLNTGTTLTVDQTAAGTFQGVIYGGGRLVIGASSSNTLQLSANNTYTGGTTINGGTVQLNVSNALPASTALSFAASVGSGTAAALNLNNNNQQVASLSGGSSTSGFIQTGSGAGGILTVVNPAGGSTTYGGVISGNGGLALGLNNTDGPNDTAALVLTGPNSFIGPVTVNSGTLRAGANWVLNGGVVMPTQPPFGPLPTPYPGIFTLAASANASFDLNNFNVAIGSLQGGGPAGGNITLGNGTGSPGTGGTLQIIQSQVTIYAGVISGNGNLIVGSSAGGRLILAGHNTYNGSTYSDVIVIATNNALPTNNNVIFGSGSTDGLDLNGFNQQVSTILGGAATNDGGIGTIVDSASGHSVLTLAYAASNPPPTGSPTAFTGVIANDVNVVIDAAIVGGTQTVEFSGPNNTTGALTVGARSNSTSSGVANSLTIDTAASVFSALTIGNGFASNLRNSVTVASSGSLTVGSVTIGDSAAGGTGSNALNVNGPVTVSGAVTIGNAIASSTSANSVVVGSGGTLNAGSLVMGGSANPYGVNTVSIASGGALLLSSPTIVGDDAHQKGSGSMIVNGSLGNATAPIAIGGLTIEAGGVLGGSGTVTTSNTGAPIVISQGLVRGGADGTGNNPLGTLTITPASVANAAKANPVTVTGTGTPGLNQTGGILTEVQRTGAGTASASLISILGTNKGLNLNTGGTGGFSSINLVLSDPTASMVPGEAYTINVAQVFTNGAIRIANTNQPAGTVIDFSNTAAAQASGTPVVGPSSGQNTNVDLYITGNNNYSNSVASWSLAVDPTGKILQLSLVSSAVPEPEHLLLVCAGVLLAGFALRRRFMTRVASI